MANFIVSNVLLLAGIALFASVALCFLLKKFAVVEDPKIDDVDAVMPGVNCGACGSAGCRDFAMACVKANQEEFYELFCPVGGMEVMKKASELLGLKVAEKEVTIAVLHCNGTCENAPDKVVFSGLSNCRLAARISVGKSGCPQGCLRFGDCVSVCKFDALSVSSEGIPVVDEEKCTSCGKCVKICPRKLFEIRPRGTKGKRVYVACSNKQKGTMARKNCKAACIACLKCAKVCSDVKVIDNLSNIPASIDALKFGEELAKCCPTKAIIYTGLKK